MFAKNVTIHPLLAFALILLFGVGATLLIVRAIDSVDWAAYPEDAALFS